jgi:hypothetical protein
MFNLFILNFPFVVLAFFDFPPCRLRSRTRVATACQGEISSGRSQMYCAKFRRLLRGRVGETADYQPSPDSYGGQATDVPDRFEQKGTKRTGY